MVLPEAGELETVTWPLSTEACCLMSKFSSWSGFWSKISPTVPTTNKTTGYFKSSVGNVLQVGSYVSDNRQYIVSNALVKFTTPSTDGNGVYYFDKNNKLKQRATLLSTDNTILWSGVKTITLEGTNFGVGNNTSGVGPVSLTNFIPTGAVPTEIIPVFNSDLPLVFEQSMLTQIELYNDFGIGYNNVTGTWYIILNADLDKTSDFSHDNAKDTTGTGIDASWVIKFTSLDKIYTVTTRAVNAH